MLVLILKIEPVECQGDTHADKSGGKKKTPGKTHMISHYYFVFRSCSGIHLPMGWSEIVSYIFETVLII
jgi:hypothetical protein